MLKLVGSRIAQMGQQRHCGGPQHQRGKQAAQAAWQKAFRRRVKHLSLLGKLAGTCVIIDSPLVPHALALIAMYHCTFKDRCCAACIALSNQLEL